jgi:uncharacterized membrane protein
MQLTKLTRTAKNAKGKLALTLLSALVLLGASTVLGAPKPSLSVSASPAAKTINAGQNATYTITIDRQNRHTGAVALSVSGLPANATGTFSLPTVPESGTVAALNLKTNQGGTTPAGTYTLTIQGTSGSAASSTTVQLTVVGESQANYSLSATPSEAVMSENESSTHQIGIARTGGFSAPVALSVSGLPNGVSGALTPNPVSDGGSTLTLTSDHNPKPGTYTVTVTGNAFTPGQVTRTTTINLIVEERPQPFEIDGGPVYELSPGAAAPIDLVLTNRENFPIDVTEITVSIDPTSSVPGCPADENYSVEQVPSGSYPFYIPANSTRTVTGDDRPRVVMTNSLTVNQDACKGASLFLDYTGAATKP